MQIMKKPIAFMMTILLFLSLSPVTVYADDPTIGPVHVVGSESDLTAALGSLASGDTIKLAADIDYPYGISIDNMTVVFDLDGHVLNVRNNSGNALSVANRGDVQLISAGALNVIAEGGPFHGVYVYDGSSAAVTNAYAIGDNGYGAYASSGSSITVVGNVSANGIESYAAYADLSGHISVGGKAAANGEKSNGAKVWDGTITIDGDVEASGGSCYGININDGSITVKGDITATGNFCQGAACSTISSYSYADIQGDITVSGDSSYGASSNVSGSSILVGGTIITSGDFSYGAQAINEGIITVNGSSTTNGKSSYAVYANGINSMIHVGQDAVASGSGVYAVYANTGSTVEVGHNVSAAGIGRSYGAYAYGGTIAIGGDLFAAGRGVGSLGANADSSGVITVSGSVMAEDEESRGAAAYGTGSNITIGNNVTAVGNRCNGVFADMSGKVTVNGNITAGAIADSNTVGARSDNGGLVIVNGNTAAIGSESYGAFADKSGSQITITQSAMAVGESCIGVFASGGSITVNKNTAADGNTCFGVKADYSGKAVVNGNITVNSIVNGFDSYGAMAVNNSAVTVSGIITSSGTNSRGVSASVNSSITVDGNVNARHSIILNGLNLDESFNPTVSGNYLLYKQSGNATIRVKRPVTPVINTNPQNLSQNEGEQAVFAVNASVSDDGTLGYQWQKSTNGGSSWSSISGATGSAFTIAYVVAGDNNSKYKCVVSNSKNRTSVSAISSVVTLSVTPAAVTPTIQAHPASLTRTAGDTAVFTVSATVTDGGILTYQWQISSAAITWSNISGATGPVLTIAAVVTEDNGSQYQCVVTNSKNGTVKLANSNAATLTVNAPAKILVSIPTPAAITGLANGTSKTAIALGLPTMVTMVTNSGNVSASVNWNVASCSYNPSAAAAQKFDVTGIAILPAGVVNTNSVPLAVSISVSVSAEAADNTGGKSSSSSKPGTKALIKTGDDKTDMISINVFNGSAFVSLNSAVNEIEMPDIKNVNQYILDIPASVLNSEEDSKRIKMISAIGTILLPDDMLHGSGINSTERVKISVGEGEKSGLPEDLQKQIGSKPLIELKLSSGDKAVEWNNPSAPVTVSIPYEPTAAELEDPEHIVVWYIDGKGNIVDVPSARYDAETGMATFSTTHFSQYAIAYVSKTFNDLGSAEWAKNPVEVLASKGIVEGLSDREYAPKKSITRGDYLCFLVRALNIEASFDESFADVSSDAYNYREIGIAKKLGITTGTGKNQFHPEREITRQDMMVLTERTLKMLNSIKSEDKTTSLDQFSDSNKIAAYAKASVDSLVKEGLITGNGNRLNPRGNTTRAEAAVFLYRIYEKYNRPTK